MLKNIALAAIALAALTGIAQAAEYDIDPIHSTALFEIGHMGVGRTYGIFTDVTGTIEYDAKKPDKNSVNVVIKTASVNTQNQMRDDHLRNEDFLDVAKYPEMSFKSTEWKKHSEDKFAVTGDFTLHGVTKQITVDVIKTGEGSHPKAGERVGFETKFTIKRSDYGMDKMIPGASDEIEITFATEGVKKGTMPEEKPEAKDEKKEEKKDQ